MANGVVVQRQQSLLFAFAIIPQLTTNVRLIFAMNLSHVTVMVTICVDYHPPCSFGNVNNLPLLVLELPILALVRNGRDVRRRMLSGLLSVMPLLLRELMAMKVGRVMYPLIFGRRCWQGRVGSDTKWMREFILGGMFL